MGQFESDAAFIVRQAGLTTVLSSDSFAVAIPPGFLTKIDPQGTAIVWSTIVQGTAVTGYRTVKCYAVSLAVDPVTPSVVRPFVTGDVDSVNGGGLPTTPNAYDSSPSIKDFDAFIAGINESGSSWQYVSYLGDASQGYYGRESHGWDLVVLSDGTVAVGGSTTSEWFPAVNAFRNPAPLVGREGFISVFDPSLSGTASLVFSSCLGGSLQDEILSITADGAGSLYVTGSTTSDSGTILSATATPLVTAASPFDVRHGPQDTFLFKIVNHAVSYGALVGGVGDATWPGLEVGYSIEFNGNTVFIGGMTSSNDFDDVVNKPPLQVQGVVLNNRGGLQSTYGTSSAHDGGPPDLHTFPIRMDGFLLRFNAQ